MRLPQRDWQDKVELAHEVHSRPETPASIGPKTRWHLTFGKNTPYPASVLMMVRQAENRDGGVSGDEKAGKESHARRSSRHGKS